MSEPSWKSSTLSQAFVLTTIGYGLVILVVAVGLIFKLEVETAKLIIGWASSFWGAISAAYLTARRTTGENKPNELVEQKP